MNDIILKTLLFLAYPLVHIYMKTISFYLFVEESAREIYSNDRFIFTNYHNQIIPFIHYYKKRSYYILVSKSRDGDITDYILKKYGYRTIRGSSTRGGSEALHEIHSELGKNIVMSITFDGPKGPIYRIKKGIIWLLGRTGYPLLTGYCYFSRARRIRSWDGLYVPIPFSKVLIVIDGPMIAEKRLSKSEIDLFKNELEKRMAENYKKHSQKFRKMFGKNPENAHEIANIII